MPHAALKLRPGVDEISTPALNEAGVSSCNLIRFKADPVMGALPEKLGGWQKWYTNSMVAIPRALWAWMDTNAAAHLAVGTEDQPLTTEAQLAVITNDNLVDITPRSATDNVAPAAETTSGDPEVVITDATITDIGSFDTVYIETHLSVGGVVLFGLYACTFDTSTTYIVTARDRLGNPLPATSTSTSAVVAEFDTTIDTNSVVVTLPDHGYVAGDTYPVLVSTTVGGVTLYGNYIVQSVADADTFTILSQQVASATDTGSINGGDARFVYSYGIGGTPEGSGFGTGGYGEGGYGVGSGTPSGRDTGDPISTMDWTLDNWGGILIACPSAGTAQDPADLFRPIYQWNALSGDPIATCISQAPPLNNGIFVAMPQRQIIAWGTTFTGIQDPLLLRWCDVNDYTSWIALPTNQAGSYRIPRGSRIVGGIQGPQQGLIWTDIGIWAMQYTGPQYVYSFNEIGTGCGLIDHKAMGVLNGTVYWMGPSSFFALTGDGVETILCPVWDVVFQNLDTTNTYKIRCAVNSRFGEIAWYYPSLEGGGEVDSYVKFNAILNVWDYGSLGRSAWIDQSVLGPPIGADPSTLYIYQHETSPDADGAALLASFQTGYFALSDGDAKMFMDEVWADFKYGYFDGTNNATLNVTFYVADFPGQTPQAIGPFTFTVGSTWVNPRVRGRLVSIKIDSQDTGSWWRLGNIRYRVMPDGSY